MQSTSGILSFTKITSLGVSESLYFGKAGLSRNVNQSFLCSFRCSCIWSFEESVRNSESDEIMKKAVKEWKFAFTASELKILLIGCS
jgi:hypothetical protein